MDTGMGRPPHRAVGRSTIQAPACPDSRPGRARSRLRAKSTLEQLALLLISTGELTAADLQLLPAKPAPG
jgi:hypothetical protein